MDSKVNTHNNNRAFQMLGFFVVAALVMALPEQALAAGTTGLPWEGPLDTLKRSLSGPVALAISIIAIVITGATLIFGSEIDGFARKMIVVVLVIAVIVAANSFLTTLFGTSTATIASAVTHSLKVA